MLKKLFFVPALLLILAVFTSCETNKSDEFTVDVRLNNMPDTWLVAQIRQDGEWVKLDSAETKDGHATFSGTTESPQFYYITIKDSREYIPVFVEPGTITVTANADQLREPQVEGSASHNTYQNLQTELKAFESKSEDLNQRYREAQANQDEEQMESIITEYDQMDKDKSESILEFAKNNNTSVVAPFAVMNYSYMFDVSDLKSVADVLDKSIASSGYTQSLNDRIAVLEKVAIGQPYIDFSLNNPQGEAVPLSEVANGKYVLVDFWASWCGPCRAENPNVVAAFRKFNGKGFEVFGVSFDRDYDKWVEAIEKDSLNWTHVSDLKFWNSEAGKLYGVQSIPHSILLDPDGIIIAKNLRGEELHTTLAELLND